MTSNDTSTSDDAAPRPFLSVVICTYNRCDTLPKAVASVIAQPTFKQDAELIVVDDGSTDGTAEWLHRNVPMESSSCRVLRQRNQGLSVARNNGAACARGVWIAYLDDDAIAGEDWLERMTEACHTAPHTVAVLGGPIRLQWLQPQPSWLPGALREWLTEFEPGPTPVTSIDRPQFRGANMACRADALRRVGGFSPHLGRKGTRLLSREECDLAERLAHLGFSSRSDPRPWVWHCVHGERLRRGWFYRRLFWEGVSLHLTHADLRSFHPLRRRARAVLYALRGCPRALVSGIAADGPARRTERFGHVSFQLGAAYGIWNWKPVQDGKGP